MPRAAAIVICVALRRAAVRIEPALATLAILVVVAFWLVPPVPGRLIAFGRSVNSWDTIRQFLYLEEGATASVAVTEGTGGARQFHIAGKVEASDMDVDMRLERMLGHVPALLHPNPKSILVVGVGAGVTAGSFTVHPEVERIVICEIEPVVPASARAYFGDENHHVFDDPRTTVVFDDARHFLQTTTEKFDIITSDPIHPWVRGAATLYSLEYLQLVREHLKPGGVVTQWVPLYETDERSVKSQIGTFASVFPDTTLWNPDLLEEGYDLVVLGRESETPIDEAALAKRIGGQRTAAAIARRRHVEVGGGGPEHVCGAGARPGAVAGGRGNQSGAATAAAVSGRAGGEQRSALCDLPGAGALPPVSGRPFRGVSGNRGPAAQLVLAVRSTVTARLDQSTVYSLRSRTAEP